MRAFFSAIKGERLTRLVVTLPPSLFLIVFFLIPALIMAVASFREPGEFAVWHHGRRADWV